MQRVYVLPIDFQTPVFIAVPVQGPVEEHDLADVASSQAAASEAEAATAVLNGSTQLGQQHAEQSPGITLSRDHDEQGLDAASGSAASGSNPAGDTTGIHSKEKQPVGELPPRPASSGSAASNSSAIAQQQQQGSRGSSRAAAPSPSSRSPGQPWAGSGGWWRRLASLRGGSTAPAAAADGTGSTTAGRGGSSGATANSSGSGSGSGPKAWLDRQVSQASLRWDNFEKSGADDPSSWKTQMRKTLAPKDAVRHLLHSVLGDQVLKVEVAHPTWMSPSAIQASLHELASDAKRGKARSTAALSAGLLPLSVVGAVALPLVGKFLLAANMFHTFDTHRAAQGMQALQQLIDAGRVEFVDDPQLDQFFSREDVWEQRPDDKSGETMRILHDGALRELAGLVGPPGGESADLLSHAKLARLGLFRSHGWDDTMVAHRTRLIDRTFPMTGPRQQQQRQKAEQAQQAAATKCSSNEGINASNSNACSERGDVEANVGVAAAASGTEAGTHGNGITGGLVAVTATTDAGQS